MFPNSSGTSRSGLEKISFSIPRLKPVRPKGSFEKIKAWKDKILDYEIETLLIILAWKLSGTWKDKILDYEIETKLFDITRNGFTESWKDKILDSEIETRIAWGDCLAYLVLKR